MLMKFSLRTLFIWLTALAVYFAIVFAVPVVVSYACTILMTFVMMPVIVTGVVYDRGYARTFWIGCATTGAIPYLMVCYYSIFASLLFFADDFIGDEWWMARIAFAVCHGLVLLSGGIAMAARWLIERKNRRRSTNATSGRSILHGRVTVARLKTSGAENE
jgi:hypothetical protein